MPGTQPVSDVARSMTDVAGRVFTFSERSERSTVDRMRDIDEIVAQTKLLYPEHTWSRADFMMLFFLDDMGDAMRLLVERETE